MKLSPDENADYEQTVNKLVLQITDPQIGPTLMPDDIVDQMIPGLRANMRVQVAIKGAVKARSIMFTWGEFKAALARLTKQWETEELRKITEERLITALGVAPSTEREFITGFMAKRGYDIDYHRRFFVNGRIMQDTHVEDIGNDARLTAADLALIRPRGDLLGTTEIGAALTEWCNMRRTERKQAVADLVAFDPARCDTTIDAEFRRICDVYFAEPRFAEAAVRKFIWAVKRRLLGWPVPQVHMIVLVGRQDTGKTKFCEMLYAPLAELSAELALSDLLDTRQMDMPGFYIGFCDEMAFGEDAKPAQLKSFLTGTHPSRRPMKTNISEQISINITLLATANHSLDKVIYDSSGMRRFVEIVPRKREDVGPYWHNLIVPFSWLRLWQSVDPSDADPLISQFKIELMVKQEAIRNLDNCEMWLQTFDPREHQHYRRHETSTSKCNEYFAQELYSLFRRWEEEFDPNHKTSLQRWGRDMRSLITNGRADGWSFRSVGNKSAYALTDESSHDVIPLITSNRRLGK